MRNLINLDVNLNIEHVFSADLFQAARFLSIRSLDLHLLTKTRTTGLNTNCVSE